MERELKNTIPIIGCPPRGILRSIERDGDPYDYTALEAELVGLAKELVSRNPDVAAILLECTQMPVFAVQVQEAVRLPVYDVSTMGRCFYSGLVRRGFPPWTEEEVERAKEKRSLDEREMVESEIKK